MLNKETHPDCDDATERKPKEKYCDNAYNVHPPPIKGYRNGSSGDIARVAMNGRSKVLVLSSEAHST
jgi:hypothetical protein